ncbi:MAG TPA: hypothetical protein V6C76_03585 [Drouetiella sp.]
MTSTMSDRVAEPAAQTLYGEATQQQKAPGHVSTIKALLGLNREGSPARRLIAHTIRKLEELEAAKAASQNGVGKAPTADSWHNAQAPDSFGKALFKASRTQFFVTVAIFSLMVFWLFIIRTMHHPKDDAKATPSSAPAQQVSAPQQTEQFNGTSQQSAPNFGALGFGAPASSSVAPTPGPAAQSLPQAPALSAEVPPPPKSAIPTGVSLPRVNTPIALPTTQISAAPHNFGIPAPTSPMPPAGYPAPPPVAYSIPTQTPPAYAPTGFAMPQGYAPPAQPHYAQSYAPQQTYATRPHAVHRHQVIVTR